MVIRFDFRHKKLDGDLLLTTACPVECDFCVYSCTASKEPSKWMPEKTIRRVAEEYSKNEIGIRIGGGEPFYDLEKLERCIDILLEYYKPTELLTITSGFFGFNRENTTKHLKVIEKRGFDTLVVSVDRFHLKRVPLRNIENIIEVCKQMNIEIALRISLDSLSFPLIDRVTELVVRHKLPVEAHCWGDCGRAEKLDITPIKEEDRIREYLFSRIEKFGKEYGAPSDPRYYLTHTAKRSQRVYAGEFFPTTFPNGNVYACSMTMKGCYAGNINKEDLLDMIFKFKSTFPGHYMLSGSNCLNLSNFLPDKFKWRCEFCKDMFFINAHHTVNEAIGREIVNVSLNMNFDELFKRLLKKKKSISEKEYEREFLLSFKLTEKDLNETAGEKIDDFLCGLKSNRIRFALSRPLPPCLGKIKMDDDQPQNCFECREMFTVEDGIVKLCEPLGRIGSYRLEWAKDRNQIYDYFKIEHEKLKTAGKCVSCMFRIRHQCNGMCFGGQLLVSCSKLK